MTTLNKRQTTAVENFSNSKLAATDIEMMQTATQPSKIEVCIPYFGGSSNRWRKQGEIVHFQRCAKY